MDSKQYNNMLTEHFLEDFFRIAGNMANETYLFAQLNLAFMWCSFHEGAFCPFEYSTLGHFLNVLHMVQRETLM